MHVGMHAGKPRGKTELIDFHFSVQEPLPPFSGKSPPSFGERRHPPLHVALEGLPIISLHFMDGPHEWAWSPGLVLYPGHSDQPRWEM